MFKEESFIDDDREQDRETAGGLSPLHQLG